MSWYEKNKEKHKADRKLRYQQNKEREIAKNKAWKEANPDSQRAYVKKYQQNHKDMVYKWNKSYYSRNKDTDHSKDKRRTARRKYYLKNKHLFRANGAKRKATKLQQTPKWADLKAINEFYKNCPPGHHVGHIIPLRGKEVRGLHVLDNLQYLPALENYKKGNKVIF